MNVLGTQPLERFFGDGLAWPFPRFGGRCGEPGYGRLAVPSAVRNHCPASTLFEIGQNRVPVPTGSARASLRRNRRQHNGWRVAVDRPEAAAEYRALISYLASWRPVLLRAVVTRWTSVWDLELGPVESAGRTSRAGVALAVRGSPAAPCRAACPGGLAQPDFLLLCGEPVFA